MQIELKDIQAEVGITFIYVTHDQEEALTMSNRIGVMESGKLLQVGTPEEIYERPVNRFVAEFIGEQQLEKLKIRNVKSEAESELVVDGAFVLIGTRPNTGFLEGVCELDDVGFVKVNEQRETSVPGIFAGGDCEDGFFRQAVTAAGFGCAAALTAKHYLDNLS